MSRVSAFIQNPEKHGAVDVYADGVYVMTLSEDTVIGAGLKIGSELDGTALEAIERARLRTKAYGKAYDLLSYGDMSEKCILVLEIMSYKTVGAEEIPNDILIQIIDSKDPTKIIKQGKKNGLNDAFAIGLVWLDMALKK